MSLFLTDDHGPQSGVLLRGRNGSYETDVIAQPCPGAYVEKWGVNIETPAAEPSVVDVALADLRTGLLLTDKVRIPTDAPQGTFVTGLGSGLPVSEYAASIAVVQSYTPEIAAGPRVSLWARWRVDDWFTSERRLWDYCDAQDFKSGFESHSYLPRLVVPKDGARVRKWLTTRDGNATYGQRMISLTLRTFSGLALAAPIVCPTQDSGEKIYSAAGNGATAPKAGEYLVVDIIHGPEPMGDKELMWFAGISWDLP